MAAPKGNKYAVGSNAGRPPVYATPDELIAACDEYFTFCEGEFHIEEREVFDKKSKTSSMQKVKVWDRYPEHPTITGLALYLGFDSRTSLFNYEQKEEFVNIIKRAKSRVEHEYEKGLRSETFGGCIFALKNMGWKDKIENESEVKVSVLKTQVEVIHTNVPLNNSEKDIS